MGPVISCWSICTSLLILAIVFQKSTSTTYRWSDCSNTTMFDPQSEYESHLTTVFNSLLSNATDPNGFSTASSGNSTAKDAVYGLFLCRGDQDPGGCHDCLSTAFSQLPQKYCPDRKVAVIWYEECMVRYSNKSFFGIMDDDLQISFMNVKNITVQEQSRFLKAVGEMMQNVSRRAANGGPKKKYATEAEILNSQETLYTLAQCTPDLSAGDCNKCLQAAIQQLPTSRGGRVLQPSCNVRYELYPFFIGATNSTPTIPVISPPHGGKKKRSAAVIIAIVVPIAVIAIGLIFLGVCFLKKKAKDHDVFAKETGADLDGIDSLEYDLATLQSATDNFSNANKLGQGGFGAVYKGKLINGQQIAVKKLFENSHQGVQEFTNEAMLVAKLQHRNLARLMGFCLAGENKLLVYEYVPNKSLDYFLFEGKGQLNWGMRYKIIVGIARGLLYIHQDSQYRVIHRDLKASNILLDEDMNPKISDFGTARIFGADQSQENTNRVVGTHGYMSPEYAMHGQFSPKSDVYSFGVIMLEIISGKKNSSFYQGSDDEDLLAHAWNHWSDGRPEEFLDPAIRDTCIAHEVVRCLHLALLCAQESVDKRPTMATIVLTLDTNSVTLPMPDQPGLIFRMGMRNSVSAKIIASDQTTTKSITSSVNEFTSTELEAR